MRREEEADATRTPSEAPAAAAVPPLQETILQLQRGHGNAYVQRLISTGGPVVARQTPAPAPAAAPAGGAAAPPAGGEVDYPTLIKTVKDELAAYQSAAPAAAAKGASKADKKAAADAKAKYEGSVRTLTTYLRENLPDKGLLDKYLDRPDVDQKEKVQTIGQLVSQVARMEFLLGTLFNMGTKAKWEKGNKGEFTSHYQEKMGGSGSAPWCTKFAGYAYDRVGFKTGEDKNTSVFHSGYRLRTWANKGTDVTEKKQLTDKDKTVAKGAGGSTIIDNKAWKKLRTDLEALKKPKKKAKGKAEEPAAEQKTAKQVVEDFFKTYPKPQAGDIIVKPRGDQADNEFSGGGQSHTMLVDQFDDTNFVIYTIEGNTGDKVGSHKFDLTNEKTVGGIIFLTRMGTDFFGDPSTSMAEPPGLITGLLASPWLIVGAMKWVNQDLVELNHAQKFIASGDADASVFEWIHGDKSAAGGKDSET